MSRFLSRVVAVAATSALAAGVLVVGAGPASAVPTKLADPTLSSYGPFSGGEAVTVSYTGFAAGEMVEVAVCKKVPAAGPGPSDCFPLGPGFADSASAKTTMSDGTGAGSLSIEAVKGPLGTTPAYTCGPGAGHECDFVVTNFTGTKYSKYRVKYALGITSATPAGPYAGGENVTVNFTGAGPSQSDVVALLCDTDAVIVGDGSTECDFGGMAPATVNASGAGSATIKVKKGALGNPAGSKCGNVVGSGCSIVVTDFSGRLYGARALTFKQTVATTPRSPYVGTESVVVTYDGFAAGEMLSAAVCANRPLFGPGDCAPTGPGFSDGPSAKVVTASAAGSGKVTLKLIKGALGNTTAPAWNCASGCSIVVSNFSGTKVAVKPIVIGKGQTLRATVAKVKKGRKALLPALSAQGLAVRYTTLTPRVCTIASVKVSGKSRSAVRGLRVGTCRVVVSNAGSAVYFPVAGIARIKVTR